MFEELCTVGMISPPILISILRNGRGQCPPSLAALGEGELAHGQSGSSRLSF